MEHRAKTTGKDQERKNNLPRRGGKLLKIQNLSTPPRGTGCYRKKVSVNRQVKNKVKFDDSTDSSCNSKDLFRPSYSDASDEFDDNNVDCCFFYVGRQERV